MTRRDTLGSWLEVSYILRDTQERGPHLANRGHLQKTANCLIENFNTMKIPDQCRFLALIKRTFSESKLR